MLRTTLLVLAVSLGCSSSEIPPPKVPPGGVKPIYVQQVPAPCRNYVDAMRACALDPKFPAEAKEDLLAALDEQEEHWKDSPYESPDSIERCRQDLAKIGAIAPELCPSAVPSFRSEADTAGTE